MPLHGVDMIWGSAFGTRYSGSALGTWVRHSDYRAGFKDICSVRLQPDSECRAPSPGSVFNREAL